MEAKSQAQSNAGPLDDIFKQATAIEKGIKVPSFPSQEYIITSFGAVADNSSKLNHEAIDEAIATCSNAGGGTVIIPKGTFYTGPITLKSNVNLHLESGAILKFSTNYSLYFPAVLTRWEGIDCYNTRPLIYAYNASNIAITGAGTIDGSASNSYWWPWSGKSEYGYNGGVSQNTGRPKLGTYDKNKTPVEERVMKESDGLRPQLINLYYCSSILIEGVKLLNSPFWVIHPLLCEYLIVRGVNISSHGPNSDGCDPESSSNILIDDCSFDTGDDCIAIKSGRNNDGRRWNIPSENIYVRNSKMKDGHGGVVIGSEISGGYKNLYIENCEMDSPNLERVIRIKTNDCRGGLIENVYARSVTVNQCKEAVLKINLLYEPTEDCQRDFPPTVQNVHIDDFTSLQSQYGVLIIGLNGSVNVHNITVSNSQFTGVSKGNSVTGASNVVYDNFYVNGNLVK